MMNQNNFKRPMRPNINDERFIGGGFLGPFILGGITGGLLAPSFYPRPIVYGPMYRPYPVPYYPNYQVPYTQSNQYYYYN